LRFREHGAEVVLIGQGDVEHTRAFCREQDVPFPCLADPERKAYAAYGLSVGTPLQILGPRVWWRGARALLRGHSAGKPIGDVRQMPGLFLVDRAGIIRFIHRYRDIADNPPPEVLLEQLVRMKA
jgi:peroxiredoxin